MATSSSPQKITVVIEQALRTFTCFPRSSPELRLKVWECACHHTRNVPLRAVDMHIDHLVNDSFEDVFRYSTTLPPPSVLSVCRESRASGLQNYSLRFEANYDIGYGVKVETPARIYFNVDCDRICLVGFFSSSAAKDFGCFWNERVALNANKSKNLEGEGVVISSWINKYFKDWLNDQVQEVLIYDVAFESNNTEPIEFEDAELSKMEAEGQKRISGVLRNLEKYLETYDETADRERRRSRLARRYEAQGWYVPEQFEFETQPWNRPVVKVVKVKTALHEDER
ncbi:hypothetical protein DL98DRAFT_508361 [Cadophora sp. DSE1049]|nr:hypothetical protein DL98DRAFT_508361 [Cadophora sp. DSE1049]